MADINRKRAGDEGFRSSVPIIGPIVSKFDRTIRVMLTDKGLYEKAKGELNRAYNTVVARVRTLFRRK